MVINLNKNANAKPGYRIASYDKVKIIRHHEENNLLVLENASGGVFDFYYEDLEKTDIKISCDYQVFISEYKGDNKKGEALSKIQFVELYPVL